MVNPAAWEPAVATVGLREMVATPHHLATDAGQRVLEAGGTAVDAAIAASAVLGVVYPDMCGIGGDVHALVWDGPPGRAVTLNGTGPAGSGRSREELARRHPSGLPLYGPDAVSVPGAPRAWEALHERYGRRPLSSLFEAAVELALGGFACPRRLSQSAADFEPPVPALFDGNAAIRPDAPVRFPEYARTLQAFAAGGASALVEGPMGAELARATGGGVTSTDLGGARPRWEAALSERALGVDICVPRPNSQGYLVPLAAQILERVDLPDDPDDPRQWHVMIEAVKAAGHDRDHVLDDPGERLPAAFAALEDRVARVGPRSTPLSPLGAPGDTVYLCAVDGSGTAVSMCHSLYHPWGARIRLPRSGVLLQNRGSSFSLRPASRNAIAPGRMARSTLSPTLLVDGRRLVALLGSMGGDVQPQVVLQHLVRHRVSGLGVAETVAHRRFYLHRGLTQSIWSDGEPLLGVEQRGDTGLVDELRARGHQVDPGPDWSHQAGHSQMIVAIDSGWAGAADPRSGAGRAGGR